MVSGQQVYLITPSLQQLSQSISSNDTCGLLTKLLSFRRPASENDAGPRKRRRTSGAAAADATGAAAQQPEAGLLPAPEARAPRAADRCPPHPGFIRGMCIRCGAAEAEGAEVESVALRRGFPQDLF